MTELVIVYTPAVEQRKASVTVRYRASETAQFSGSQRAVVRIRSHGHGAP